MPAPQESAAEIVARLGISPEEAARHLAGHHVCIDNRQYRVSCLVTDPTCHEVARHRLALNAADAAGMKLVEDLAWFARRGALMSLRRVRGAPRWQATALLAQAAWYRRLYASARRALAAGTTMITVDTYNQLADLARGTR
jgi:hypothetical protein